MQDGALLLWLWLNALSLPGFMVSLTLYFLFREITLQNSQIRDLLYSIISNETTTKLSHLYKMSKAVSYYLFHITTLRIHNVKLSLPYNHIYICRIRHYFHSNIRNRNPMKFQYK